MQVIRWAQDERVIPPEEQSDFWDKPLAKPHLFAFRTRRLDIAPHAGAFSLKLMLDGAERYRFGRHETVLRSGEFLLVPEGRVYASAIDRPARSASIFLPAADAEILWGDAADPAPVPLKIDEGGRAILATIASAGSPEEAWQASAQLLEICRARYQSVLGKAKVQTRRAATRLNLLARAARARDFIHDNAGRGCDLDTLASVACLSKFHFVRVFAAAFGTTPVAYARRLDRAA